MDEYTLHDAHAIFCEVFHSDMSYEAFRHKHVDNPNCDQEIMTLVDYQKGNPAGTNSFMGCVILIDGEQMIYSLQSCDTAVIPSFRGRHIFSHLIQRAMDVCQERNNTFLFGFPNPNSYPGFLKLGFIELGKLDFYVRILHPFHILTRKFFHYVPALPPFKPCAQTDGNWSLSLRCPFTEEDLALINRRPGVHLQRSLKFYQWKMDWLPKGEVAYLCARKNGRLEAFLILKRCSDGTCMVCDWMLPENLETSRQLLKKACLILRPYCNMLAVHMVNPTGKESTQLKSGGFFRRNAPPAPFLIYPTAGLGEEVLARLKDLRNWSIRYIDVDTVLN